MSKFNNYPKPLKGGESFLSEFDPNTILDLSNVTITGGTIDGVIIGGSNPATGYFTNLYVSQNTSTSSITNLSSITFQGNSSITETNGNIVIDSNIDTIIQDQLQVNNNTTITGNLTVLGTINTVPATPPLGMTIENLNTILPSSVNCSNAINISFLTFTGTGTSTGYLYTASFDGFYKIICIAALPTGSEYQLEVENLLDPGSGTISNKQLIFKYPGQSITLIYSLTSNCYISTFGGTV